jgi:hypothetical protein
MRCPSRGRQEREDQTRASVLARCNPAPTLTPRLLPAKRPRCRYAGGRRAAARPTRGRHADLVETLTTPTRTRSPRGPGPAFDARLRRLAFDARVLAEGRRHELLWQVAAS